MNKNKLNIMMVVVIMKDKRKTENVMDTEYFIIKKVVGMKVNGKKDLSMVKELYIILRDKLLIKEIGLKKNFKD